MAQSKPIAIRLAIEYKLHRIRCEPGDLCIAPESEGRWQSEEDSWYPSVRSIMERESLTTLIMHPVTATDGTSLSVLLICDFFPSGDEFQAASSVLPSVVIP